MSPQTSLTRSGGSTLPFVRPQEALEKAVASALEVAKAVWSLTEDVAGMRAAIARVEGLDLQDLGRRLDAAMQPATVKDVAALTARLVAGYPTKNRDPEFGITILFDEVAATSPSIGALHAAIRHLLRTETFLPAISEVLDAVGEAERALDNKRRELAEIPERLEQARAWLEYLERRPQELEREKQENEKRLEAETKLKIEQCLQLLLAGCEREDRGKRMRIRLRSLSPDLTGDHFHISIIQQAAEQALAMIESWPDEVARRQVLASIQQIGWWQKWWRAGGENVEELGAT
jgi:hypothetical protein